MEQIAPYTLWIANARDGHAFRELFDRGIQDRATAGRPADVATSLIADVASLVRKCQEKK